MNNDAGDRSRVIRYLLGQVKETEKADVEQRGSVDPAYADFCNDVEEELIDAYLQGELSGEDADHFRRYYLISPERQRKVEFTRALLTSFTKTRSRSAIWNASVGAAAALAMAAIIWVFLGPRQPATVSFTLTPGVVRTLGPPTILNVPRGVVLLAFHLGPENGLKGNRALIRAVDSPEEILSERIKPSSDGRFDLQVPSTVLPSGDYVLTVETRSEVIASYFFRLTKQ